MMDSLFIKYGIMAGTSEQTVTPSTSTVSRTHNTVTFNIQNNDALTASVAWEIRQSTTGGTTRNSGTATLNSGANTNVSASSLSENTTYWLTNVFATASGKDQSEKGTDRSQTTTCTPNGTLLSSSCSGGSLIGTYANGSCGTFNQTISGCSTSCGCDPCAGCPASGSTFYNCNTNTYTKTTFIYTDNCCSSSVDSQEFNSPDCGYVAPPPGPTCAERQGEVISSACISGTTRRITTYDGGGTYPNCTTSFQDISDPSCSSGGCLDENTIVPLFDGSYKVIKDLEVGDELVGYYVEGMIDEDIPGWEEWKTDSPNEGMIIPVTLNSVKKDTYHSYYLINNSIKITIKHPFFASRDGLTWGWIDTPDLKVGDKVFTIDKEVISISSIEFIEDTINVVTLNVEEVDCYFATENNILVHNDIVKG